MMNKCGTSSPRIRTACFIGRLTSFTLRTGGLILASTLTLLAFEQEARAYTDPGTTALIWQMLAAGFVGAAFYFRRFLNWFKSKRNANQATTQARQAEHRSDAAARKG